MPRHGDFRLRFVTKLDGPETALRVAHVVTLYRSSCAPQTCTARGRPEPVTARTVEKASTANRGDRRRCVIAVGLGW